MARRASGNGGLIMMHAENGIAIDVLVEQALAEGRTDPRHHGEVRKVLLEAEATTLRVGAWADSRDRCNT
ncbi:hypothetical protein QR77_34445 [Streptomyces sp. 150FB]|nr:hypothetical protein QR77_34445 [Streptomyces sp. 150FB]